MNKDCKSNPFKNKLHFNIKKFHNINVFICVFHQISTNSVGIMRLKRFVIVGLHVSSLKDIKMSDIKTLIQSLLFNCITCRESTYKKMTYLMFLENGI